MGAGLTQEARRCGSDCEPRLLRPRVGSCCRSVCAAATRSAGHAHRLESPGGGHCARHWLLRSGGGRSGARFVAFRALTPDPDVGLDRQGEPQEEAPGHSSDRLRARVKRPHAGWRRQDWPGGPNQRTVRGTPP